MRLNNISVNSSLLPVAGVDDLRAGGESVHDIHPACVFAAIGERRLDEFPVVEPGIAFEPVNVRPVLERNLDHFGMDDRVSGLFEVGEPPARVVERPLDRTGRDVDGIFAESMVAFPGHEGSVGDKIDGFHYLGLLLSLRFRKSFLWDAKAFGTLK